MLKVWKKTWEPFGSCLLNNTANPAKLGWNWAGLAVLFSRQLPNGSHDFFQTFSIYLFNHFIKNPQTSIALPFLTNNISAIGGVFNECGMRQDFGSVRRITSSFKRPSIYFGNSKLSPLLKNFRQSFKRNSSFWPESLWGNFLSKLCYSTLENKD